jgi:hypothetical protein
MIGRFIHASNIEPGTAGFLGAFCFLSRSFLNRRSVRLFTSSFRHFAGRIDCAGCTVRRS